MAYNNVSTRLQQLLHARGVTQSALADAVGTTPATVSRITAGKAGLTVDMAHRIAAKTGVRAGWLLTGELPMYAGQDMGAVARQGYLDGWRDAVAAMEEHLRQVADVTPESDRPAKRQSKKSAKVGILNAPAGKRPRRRKL